MTSAALIRRRRSSASLLSLYSALGIRPELAFDFANERYFTSRVPTTFSDAITHTRASTATYVDSSGVLQTAASGEPRVGHHVWDGSAWVNEGLLHESEARTNLVTNNQLSGAVVGVIGSGGALPTNWSSSNFDTVEVVSIDTWLGKDRIRIKGTRANATGSSVFPNIFFQTGLTLSASVAYNGSLWFGEGPDQTGSRASLLLSDGPTLFVNQQITAPGTFADPVFFTRSGSTSAAPTALGSMRLAATVEDGNTEVFDWVIVLPQLEQGATPSSPIPTSGSAVTRAADVLTIPSANLPWPSPVVIGSELITNGDFSNGTTGWTSNFGATLSISNGALRVEEDGVDASTARAHQIITTEVGKVYRVSVDLVDTNDDFEVYINNNTNFGGAITSSTGLTAPQTIELFFVATSTSTYVLLGAGSTVVGTYCEYDNISVREINPLAVSIQMDGRVTYADEDTFEQVRFVKWTDTSPTRAIQLRLETNSTNTGKYAVQQIGGDTTDRVVRESGNSYSPDVLVLFNVAGRFGSNFLNGANDGVAMTERTDIVALPDLSTTDLPLASRYNGTIRTFRVWANDIGDTGIEEAST